MSVMVFEPTIGERNSNQALRLSNSAIQQLLFLQVKIHTTKVYYKKVAFNELYM